MTPKTVWEQMPPHTRMENIKGLHPLAYGGTWRELEDGEKAIVRQFVKGMKE